MAVRRQIHRHAGNRCREIGPVIEIEATQIILIRLSLAAVLTDRDAWHCFEHFAGPHHRPGVELSGGDGALAGR